MVRCVHCGKTWSGLKLEHCSVCHETFTSSAPGDAHRVGDFEDGSRRCLTPEEMCTRPKRPLAQNRRGYWTFAAWLESAPERVRVLTEAPENGPEVLPGTPSCPMCLSPDVAKLHTGDCCALWDCDDCWHKFEWPGAVA